MSIDQLAIFGGKPLVSQHDGLRIDWPRVDSTDRDAVIAAFDRGDFSGRCSNEVLSLETEMATFFQMPYGTAMNSGTAALHAALFALGIGAGDEVIVPNLCFIATALAVIQAGATPLFADVDRFTSNVTVASIFPLLTKKTKAVIVVHMHGVPVDLDPIVALCKSNGIFVIEDNAQSPGARYKGKLVGGIGDVSTFSLMSQKNLATCGECGMLLMRTLQQKNRAEMLKIYGEVIRPGQPRVYNSFTWGWNYALNPIQAAMARTQLARFDRLTAEIQSNGLRLARGLDKYDWVFPPLFSDHFQSVFHFFRFRVQPKPEFDVDVGRFRKAVQDALDAEGLNVRHYQNSPLSMQPVFRGMPLCLPSAKEMEGTLDVLRSTLVIGAIGSTPAYLLKDGTVEKYLTGFEKIDLNMKEVISYAKGLKYSDPWEAAPVTSDSFGAIYQDARF